MDAEFLKNQFSLLRARFSSKISVSLLLFSGAFDGRGARNETFVPEIAIRLITQLPSSESTPLINHFSSEKSGGTVTDSKISQEKKIPTRLMKSRFKARSTRMHVAGWMRKSLRSARCLTRQKIIFQSSADRTRHSLTTKSFAFLSCI